MTLSCGPTDLKWPLGHLGPTELKMANLGHLVVSNRSKMADLGHLVVVQLI